MDTNNGIVKSESQLVYKELFENSKIELSNHEVKVYKALLKTKIKDYVPEKLISNLTDLLTNVIKDSGIRQGLEDHTLIRICDILLTYYGHLTLDEVRISFELSFIGKLNDYLPKDKYGAPDNNHYQSLSLDYIAKILNAYIKYKNSFLGKLDSNKKEIKSLPESIDYKSLIIERFEYYKRTGEMPVMVSVRVMEYLKPYGLEPVTDPEKIEGFRRLEAMKKYERGAIRSLKDAFNMAEITGEVTAAEVSIKEYFDSLIKQGKDLKQILQNQ